MGLGEAAHLACIGQVFCHSKKLRFTSHSQVCLSSSLLLPPPGSLLSSLLLSAQPAPASTGSATTGPAQTGGVRLTPAGPATPAATASARLSPAGPRSTSATPTQTVTSTRGPPSTGTSLLHLIYLGSTRSAHRLCSVFLLRRLAGVCASLATRGTGLCASNETRVPRATAAGKTYVLA